MRIVVDTNVFVSAALKANSLPFIVVRWIDRNGGLLKSTATEHEVLHVLERPHLAAVTILSFRDGLARDARRRRTGDHRRTHRRVS